eukprot:4640894-Amphidinium_carterae.1
MEGAYDWKILMSASAPDQAGAQTSMAEALQKDARVITNYVSVMGVSIFKRLSRLQHLHHLHP